MSDKLDKIQEDVTDIKVAIVEIQKDINYHIMRTDLAEKHLELLEKELEPVKKHVERINFLGQIGIWLIGVAGFIATVLEIKKSL